MLASWLFLHGHVLRKPPAEAGGVTRSPKAPGGSRGMTRGEHCWRGRVRWLWGGPGWGWPNGRMVMEGVTPLASARGFGGRVRSPEAPGGSRWGDAWRLRAGRLGKWPDGDGSRHPLASARGFCDGGMVREAPGRGARSPEAPGGSRWGDAWRTRAAAFTPSAGLGIRARMPPRLRRPACRRAIACCRHASTNADAFPRDSTTPANTMP